MIRYNTHLNIMSENRKGLDLKLGEGVGSCSTSESTQSKNTIKPLNSKEES